MSETKKDLPSNNSQIKNTVSYNGDNIELVVEKKSSLDSEGYVSNETEYVFHNLSPASFYPVVGCFYCKTKLSLETGCYLFCQYKEHWDRDISIVCCSDTCTVAMKTCIISSCQICERDYIHNRYDSDICRLCHKNNKE